MKLLLLLLGFLAGLSGAVPAKAADPDSALRTRAEALVAVLDGRGEPADQFTSAFLAEVPAARIAAISAQLRDQLGQAQGVGAVSAETSGGASVEFVYARGTATMRLVIDEEPPHRISGLLVTGTRLTGDSTDKLGADIRALPGTAGLAIHQFGDEPKTVLAIQGDRPFAIGSAFKLYVLAELMRSVDAGARRWDEVVPLISRSLPSGILQDWPATAPVTLHTLAALMISRSDNSATDRLIDVLGRERIEAVQRVAGHATPQRNAPWLTTSELFLLKGKGGAAMLKRWTAGDTAERRKVLADMRSIDRARFDYGSFTRPPLAIDTAEWFASPADLVRVLDWIRRNDRGGHARAILAINGGIRAPGVRYLGYKGGSEPGVVAMAFLVQGKSGAWYAVAGSWNDPAAVVDEARFAALMTRAVRLAVE